MKSQNKYNLRTQLYFKNMYGEPFRLTKGQEDIFRLVFEPNITRSAVAAVTQYGKSEVASMAIICAAVERKEKIVIVSPSMNQSRIIMGKVIDNFFGNPNLVGMIDYHGKLDQLKQERSKKRITTRNGSEIMALTADASTITREAKNLMGFGASIVVLDESSLITDGMYSKILRMVGGVRQGKIVQLGNPFVFNHFGRALTSDRYESVTINYRQALKEKRITQEMLDEAREEMSEMDWQIFYECKFPSTGPEDALIPKVWIDGSVQQKIPSTNFLQAGLDVARFGRDKTVYILRQGGHVKKIVETEQMDTMEVVGWVRNQLDTDKPEIMAVDVIGIGSGVYDRLKELGYSVEAVNVGEKASEEGYDRFFNQRAEIFWNLRKRFQPDKHGNSSISIPNDQMLRRELGEIKYSYSSEKKIRLEKKEEMKKRLGKSPDRADALALAFVDLTDPEEQLIII